MKKELSTGFNARQYMNSGEFEVFFYKDANPGHIVNHSHPYYEFYFFLNGDVTYEVEGRQYNLQYGDYLLIPPGTNHHPVFGTEKQEYRRFVLWISQPYYERLLTWSEEFDYSFHYAANHQEYRFHMDFITFRDIQGKLLDLIEELRGAKPFHDLNASLMVHSFLLAINRITFDLVSLVPAAYGNVLYLNICDYINNHLEEDLSLDRLAAFFYASKYHISHIFKDNMGISLHQYILKKRLQAAKNAVLAGTALGEVCHQYGFSDYTSFYRAFKKEYGLSPKEFREQRAMPEGY